MNNRMIWLTPQDHQNRAGLEDAEKLVRDSDRLAAMIFAIGTWIGREEKSKGKGWQRIFYVR